MRSKHGFRHISRLPEDATIILCEAWVEYATKSKPSPQDRAKNVSYDIPAIGKVTISQAAGTMVIESYKDWSEIERTLKKWLPKEAFEYLMAHARTPLTGSHFTKYHGTTYHDLKVDKPGIYRIFFSGRLCNNYIDIHGGVYSKNASFVPPVRDRGLNGILKVTYTAPKDALRRLPPTRPPNRKNLSDITILEFVKLRVSVTTGDAKHIDLSKTAFYRRLEKLVQNEQLMKTPGKPAVYTLPQPH